MNFLTSTALEKVTYETKKEDRSPLSFSVWRFNESRGPHSLTVMIRFQQIRSAS